MNREQTQSHLALLGWAPVRNNCKTTYKWYGIQNNDSLVYAFTDLKEVIARRITEQFSRCEWEDIPLEFFEMFVAELKRIDSK